MQSTNQRLENNSLYIWRLQNRTVLRVARPISIGRPNWPLIVCNGISDGAFLVVVFGKYGHIDYVQSPEDYINDVGLHPANEIEHQDEDHDNDCTFDIVLEVHQTVRGIHVPLSELLEDDLFHGISHWLLPEHHDYQTDDLPM